MLKTKCPNCNSMINKKWLLLSGDKDIYTCSNCGTKLKWNIFNRISLILSVLSSNYIIVFTKEYWFNSSSIWNIILSSLIITLIGIGCFVIYPIILPNQFSIKKD